MTTFLLFTISWVMLLTGCSDEPSALVGTTTLPSTATPIGQVQPDRFYASVFTANKSGTQALNHFIHQYDSSDPTKVDLPCEVTATSTNKQIVCYAEAPELDLFTQGIGFQYNAPENFCAYVRSRNFWYFAGEPVTGPTSVDMTIVDGVVTACQLNGPGSIGSRACPTSEATARANSNEVAYRVATEVNCLGDYTKAEQWPYSRIKKNCCWGKYQKTLTTTDNGVTSVSTSTENWGGDHWSCIDGPATVTNFTPGEANTVPGSVYYYALNGINLGYDLRVEKTTDFLKPNYYYANFFGDSNITNSTLPAPFSHTLRGGTVGQDTLTTQPSYDIECLDRHWDIIASIKIYIRSWKTLTEFNTYKSTGSGNPQTPGDYAGANWLDLFGFNSSNVQATPAAYLQFPNYLMESETVTGFDDGSAATATK